MRRQLLRGVMVAAVAAVGAFAVHAAMAQDDTNTTGTVQGDQTPAQLDRTYGQPAQPQDEGIGGAGTEGMQGTEQPGMGAGMDGGTGGTGMEGMEPGTEPGMGAGMDGGTGGASLEGTEPGMGAGMDGGTGGTGNAGEAVEDEGARERDHTNIIIYGPNGVPAEEGESTNDNARTPSTQEQTMGAGEDMREGAPTDQGAGTGEESTTGTGPNADTPRRK